MRPKPPKKDAGKQAWLDYWIALKKWATPRRVQVKKNIERDKALIAIAQHYIKEIEQKIRENEINWNGKPALPHYAKEIRLAQHYGLYITATVGRPGVHSPTSYHYSPPRYAVDMGHSSVQPMMAAQEALLRHFGPGHFKELFGPCAWYVKNGVKYPGAFPAHGDHIHFAA